MEWLSTFLPLSDPRKAHDLSPFLPVSILRLSLCPRASFVIYLMHWCLNYVRANKSEVFIGDYWMPGLVLCGTLPGPGDFTAHRTDKSLTKDSGPITQWQEMETLRPQSERRMAEEVNEPPRSQHLLLGADTAPPPTPLLFTHRG